MIRLGLVGADIAHSMSPRLFHAAFDVVGLRGQYDLLSTPAELLETTLAQLSHSHRGINITAPHKHRAWQWAEAQNPGCSDDAARHSQSCNVLLFDHGRVVAARNTDVDGLLLAWRQQQWPLAGEHLVVVGAGGAAAAVCLAAAHVGVGTVTVLVRAAADEQQQQRRRHLERLAAAVGLSMAWLPHEHDKPPAGVVVAATSAPVSMLLSCGVRAGGFVHDLRTPPRATWLNTPQAAGLLQCDGRSMLVGQALAAFEDFTGVAMTPAVAAAMVAAT